MPKQAFPTVQDAAAEERPGKWDYLALLLLALLPRLVLGLMFLNLPLGLDDMFQYDMLARSLAGGEGYRWYGRADAERMLPTWNNIIIRASSLSRFQRKAF